GDDPVLDVMVRSFVKGLPERALDQVTIFGNNLIEIRFERASEAARRASLNPFELLKPMDSSGQYVPFPKIHARGRNGQPQTLFLFVKPISNAIDLDESNRFCYQDCRLVGNLEIIVGPRL